MTNNCAQTPLNDIRDDKIDSADILEVAQLSRLAVDEQTAEGFAEDIDKILDMMKTIASVETDELAPLSNIHEAAQQLRADIPNPNIDRELNQSIAPNVEQGLYLVPQVMD